ncbi:hypothetical protein [Insolitispirillum peregrinum]|uniref:Uncharacterized protein n=1 Tax=Insolitispirillum peregrinum TaxID=80876 RepID=A0A1N7MF04_9PROT|nr:hypothetical protein [Insolitispirillum peregrinum]SIS84600.1 hypothetical protein SAMN05421779_10478 [Insolitispirillum peregrinum]
MVSSLLSSGSSSRPSYLSALTARTGSSKADDTANSTSASSTPDDSDNRSIADKIQSSMAQRKKQDALDDVLRLKQQMADMAVLELVNPEGAARMYAEMGKKLEHAAGAYSDGTQTLAKLSGDATSLTELSVNADLQAIVNSSTSDATATSSPATDASTSTRTTEDASKAAKKLAEQAQNESSTRQKQMQAYAMASSSAADDHQTLVDMKSLSGTLDERFRHAVKTTEEQDQSEDKKREMDQLESEFAVSQAHTASALDSLGQQITLSRAGGLSLSAPTSVSVLA